MNRLRNRLIAAFLAATLLPFAATVWITTTLIDRSLAYSTTSELERLSRTLEATVRLFYQREREALKQDVLAGRAAPTRYAVGDVAAWPEPVRAFWNSGEPERFGVSGASGDHLDYMRRADGDTMASPGVEAFSRDLRGIRMDQLSAELRQTRETVESMKGRDLRRGFTLTLLVLLGAAWVISLAPLIFIAHRISQPIQHLTAGLTDFAGGDWDRRVETGTTAAPRDEVGRAVDAFNRMADQLRANRERLVYLTQMASWQSLARKTAHELKNSLTPIRLTVEEIQVRQPADRAFIDQAVQIVVSEIDALERRVRAFSEFSSEPAVTLGEVDVNALVTERVALQRLVHTGTTFELRVDAQRPSAHADADLVKGILTNLLQNAAEAAGPRGVVRITTMGTREQVAIEIHDSGPGMSADAAATLFEPTITFKKHGMGLGLSIAKKNAILSNGDIALIDGQLGGAAFRVALQPFASGGATERTT